MALKPLPSLRILIVDPRPNNITLLRSILAALGSHQIAATDNTETALQTLRDEVFDVVFCDEGAAPLNPVAFTKAIRRDKEGKHSGVHILVVTSAARKRQVELARDCGANHIIVRPMSLNTVRRKLEALVVNPPIFVKTENFCGPDRRRYGRPGDKAAATDPERRLEGGRRKSDVVEQPSDLTGNETETKEDFFL